jgi:hypothetical protein
MKRTFFPPDGVITNRQEASFLNRMMELHKRFKDGVLSPEFTLQGLQDLVEGKYATKTTFGILKLFGPPVEVFDKETPNGFGPDQFFKNSYADFAEMFSDDRERELLPLFSFKRGACPENVKLAPYRVNRKARIVDILGHITFYRLCPRITLGHIDNLISRFISGARPNDTLFEGDNGNFFLIYDVNNKPWFVWVGLHPTGEWNYKFVDGGNFVKELLCENARLWLLSVPS